MFCVCVTLINYLCQLNAASLGYNLPLRPVVFTYVCFNPYARNVQKRTCLKAIAPRASLIMTKTHLPEPCLYLFC